MNLENLISQINEVDETLIIFQKDKLDFDSEIALFEQEENGGLVFIKENNKYIYLLEVNIAKDLISGWIEKENRKLNDKEIALRLFQYAINDA